MAEKFLGWLVFISCTGAVKQLGPLHDDTPGLSNVL